MCISVGVPSSHRKDDLSDRGSHTPVRFVLVGAPERTQKFKFCPFRTDGVASVLEARQEVMLPLCAGASFLFANKQDVMSLMSRSGSPRGRNRRGAEEIRLASSPLAGSSSYSASDGPPSPFGASPSMRQVSDDLMEVFIISSEMTHLCRSMSPWSPPLTQPSPSPPPPPSILPPPLSPGATSLPPSVVSSSLRCSLVFVGF